MPADPERTDAGTTIHGYHVEFTRTGDAQIDAILTAVADAARAFHSTAQWSEPDTDGVSPVDRIQQAANHAAVARSRTRPRPPGDAPADAARPAAEPPMSPDDAATILAGYVTVYAAVFEREPEVDAIMDGTSDGTDLLQAACDAAARVTRHADLAAATSMNVPLSEIRARLRTLTADIPYPPSPGAAGQPRRATP